MKSQIVIATALLATTAAAAAATPPGSGDWGTAQKIDEISGNSSELNTPALDGCPILSPDGLSLYMASNRLEDGEDEVLDLNIWVARREATDEPFEAPSMLPDPVNSAAADFCPTPLRGGRLLFVSNRSTDESCGQGDIYLTRETPRHGWREPTHLACDPEGPNSRLDEQGPSLVEIDVAPQLFFSRSSSTPGHLRPGDLFVSEEFGPASLVSELNSAGNDIQPNVRKDGREIVFSSNYGHPGAQGGQDIYAATRASTDDPWSAPVNLGPEINKPSTPGRPPFSETRPSFSWDANTLLFGRAPGPEGGSDIYVSTR